MRKFSIVLLLFAVAAVFGCTKKIDVSAKDPVWERDICERCKMSVGDKFYSGQVVNGMDGKRYYFDDFGCAVLWLADTDLTWKDKAILYVTDAKTGKWVSSAEATYATGYVTPMSFGIAAFKDKASVDADKPVITYDAAVQTFKDIRAERMKKKAAQKNPAGGEAAPMAPMTPMAPAENAPASPMGTMK